MKTKIMRLFAAILVLSTLFGFSGCDADSQAPETTLSETTIPATAVSETTVPKTTVLETTAHETTVPETTVPETTIPETTIQETVIPETTVPETTVPEATVPETIEPEPTEPTAEPTEPPAPHTHNYQTVSVVDATCNYPGVTKYACSCGKSYEKTTPALTHDWNEGVIVKEATYEEKGRMLYTCSRCGEVQYAPIPKLEQVLTDEDAIAIAQLTMQYINELRNAEGACTAVEMPGCTLYAQYRSRQMAEKRKVEHNYDDGIKAATELKYGLYIDPVKDLGREGEPYYQVYGAEAVGSGSGKTVEEVARSLADGVHASDKHWAYVGADKNGYISIGVAKNGGKWYCCIIVCKVNLDENPRGF